MLVKVRYQVPHHPQRKPFLVQRKHTSTTHVVNIGPHGLKWNTGTAIIVNDLGDLEDILVAISAVVELEYSQRQSIQKMPTPVGMIRIHLPQMSSNSAWQEDPQPRNTEC